MLTEERYAAILSTLAEQKIATVSQLAARLRVSESTIRRDLIALDNAGRLSRVHGGATLNHNRYLTQEEDITSKQVQHNAEKEIIGRHAAALIEPDDFIYLDAGTTTFKMLEHLPPTDNTYVTNGILHASKLAALGLKVYVASGRLKANTQAISGTEAVKSLMHYNFTKGFFGTNGISDTAGFSTADFSEGNVKTEAFRHCQQRFIVSDSSKFGKIFPVTFAPISDATIITEKIIDPKYKKLTNIMEVGEK